MKNIKTFEEYNNKTFKEYFDSYVDHDITKQEYNIAFKDLTDLNGVGFFKNLKKLSCHTNKITSLEGIENLNKLIILDCGYNNISSLKPIENLIKLKQLFCEHNPIDWIDYIDKDGRTYYFKLPKSIIHLVSDKFGSIKEYWEFMDKNQPSGISRKFNF